MVITLKLLFHSWTGDNNENLICVKFYAALQKDIDTKHDKMYLVIYPNKINVEMTPIR